MEYFISYEDTSQNILLGFIRLRFPIQIQNTKLKKSKRNLSAFPLLDNTALIRELHVYGMMRPTSGENKEYGNSVQHFGYGHKLLKAAEQISSQNGFRKIAVISGVGVRNYYRRFGYKLRDTYMIKTIEPPNDKIESHDESGRLISYMIIFTIIYTIFMIWRFYSLEE